MANAHRRRNYIARIKINGAWLFEDNKINEGVAKAYHILLFHPKKWRPSINGLDFKVLEG